MTLRLELRGITKQYPSVRANDGVSLKVEPGQIHAVLGENGAGKSTLMKIIYGAVKPDAGQAREQLGPPRWAAVGVAVWPLAAMGCLAGAPAAGLACGPLAGTRARRSLERNELRHGIVSEFEAPLPIRRAKRR